MILEYILKFHLQDCLQILNEEDNLGYYNIKIDFLKVFETYPDVGDKVLCAPIESLPACSNDIIKAQQNILEQDEYKQQVQKLNYKSLKRNVHARFFGLPVCPELHRTVFPKNVDLGCFLKVTGTIVRVTQAKMLEYQRKYVCLKCKYENEIVADFENRYILKAPGKCGNEDTRCKSSTFTQVHMVSREYCKDYQEIKIQELVNKLSIGTIPGSMWVVLENDLVDSCKPGDDVNICGTVRRRWRPTSQNKKAEVELVLQANYVEVCNSQRSDVVSTAPDVKECFSEFWEKFEGCPLKGRDQILAAVCPQVYGLHLVKLAVLLTVITGSNHIADSEQEKRPSQEDNHTTRVRGQCHLLLVGEPGTGKSQLLRTGADLTARSVFTSGAGSTRAGLTCAALREDGEWQLEAGALVLSDGGVCCIDEISQLREHDRTAIHEAMEQQTISIAKAGIVCKLNTRCAVIAACNPKGHYQTDQPLSVNVSLGTPLLSRFDLIFILLDSKNKAWDKLVSSYILFGGVSSTAKKEWSLEKIQMYISLVGPKPTNMTKSANMILQSYYMMQRKSEYRDPSRTTVRMLDSLVRLSQAHCRLMYRTTILPMDAVVAVSLVDLSMQDCTLSDTVDALHSTFQKYPDFDYLCTAKKLLTRLGLDDIWKNELLYYGKLLQVDHKTLENDVNRVSTHLFAKFDDVTDDNIPLSSSLVTSSYFNNKKAKDNEDKIEEFEGKENIDSKNNFEDAGVSKKFAATLKKHATLNKAGKKIPQVQKKKNSKRKRKEVTIDVKLLQKNAKKARKSKNKEIMSSGDTSDSAEDKIDAKNILNAVPSVNDIFTDLGIDFKLESSDNCDDVEHQELDNDRECHSRVSHQNENQVDKSTKTYFTPIVKSKDLRLKSSDNEKGSINHGSQINKTTQESSHKNVLSHDNKLLRKNLNKTPNKTIDKLKEFQFTKNHDLNKFYDEKPNKESSDTSMSILKLDYPKDSSNSKEKPSISRSQISIFETSDCDINFEEPDTNIKVNEKTKDILESDLQNITRENSSKLSSQISIFETSDCDIVFTQGNNSENKKSKNQPVVKLDDTKSNVNNTEKKSTIANSQISIFETSADCDIDLDI